MRILTLVPLLGAGGAEAVAVALAVDSAARGHRPVVASAPGFRTGRLAELGVPHWSLPLDGRRPASLAAAVVRLRRRLATEPVDLVHAHNVKAALVARLAAGRSGRVVVTVHGVADGEYAASARLLRRCADHVVAVSDHVRDRLVACGLDAATVEVIENSVTPHPVRPREQARARLGLSRDARVALCVARLARQKRHDLLLTAWAGLPTDTHLLLAGDGPTRPEVEAAVGRLDLRDRVQVLGERHDVDWLLAAADLLVLPTDWEGLPLTLLEAMAAGVPVVASRVGGVADVLEEGLRAVEPGSAVALGTALAELLDDPHGSAGLGRRGRALVERRFPPDGMPEAYDRLYRRLHDPVDRVTSGGTP